MDGGAQECVRLKDVLGTRVIFQPLDLKVTNSRWWTQHSMSPGQTGGDGSSMELSQIGGGDDTRTACYGNYFISLIVAAEHLYRDLTLLELVFSLD